MGTGVVTLPNISTDALTVADITSAYWSLALDVSAGAVMGSGAGIGRVVEGAADIDQCIWIILSTPLGSDPFRPTFGMDPALYIDVPVALLATKFVGPAKLAIETWEPRITVNEISVQLDPQNIGHITVTVSWQFKNQTAQFSTKVTL